MERLDKVIEWFKARSLIIAIIIFGLVYFKLFVINSMQAGERSVSGEDVSADISVSMDELPAVSGGDADVSQSDMTQSDMTYREKDEVEYMWADDDYFADAVFIGDSRTVGMFEYGKLEDISTFYASTGLTVYKLFEAGIVEVPGEKERATIEQMLTEKQFAKIYLMIGINDMGVWTADSFVAKYAEVLEHLRELQPDAIIYIQGIMKVTTERSEQGDYITNEGIAVRNSGIAKLADNVHTYYLDVNPSICDETGGMVEDYTSDGVHLKAQYIHIWKDFLKQNAVANPPGGQQ